MNIIHLPDGSHGYEWRVTDFFQLNGIESLCLPPNPRDSKMAAAALNLLKTQHRADMMFEILPNIGKCRD